MGTVEESGRRERSPKVSSRFSLAGVQMSELERHGTADPVSGANSPARTETGKIHFNCPCPADHKPAMATYTVDAQFAELDYCTTKNKCHEEVLYLQPLIPPKRFDIFSPITGGCSEGLGAL